MLTWTLSHTNSFSAPAFFRHCSVAYIYITYIYFYHFLPIVALAATVPWLELVVALLGAVKMSTLSIMAPAIIDTASNWSNLGRYKWVLIKNVVIFLFGLFGCIMGTYVALRDIVRNFQEGASDPS